MPSITVNVSVSMKPKNSNAEKENPNFEELMKKQQKKLEDPIGFAV